MPESANVQQDKKKFTGTVRTAYTKSKGPVTITTKKMIQFYIYIYTIIQIEKMVLSCDDCYRFLTCRKTREGQPPPFFFYWYDLT